MSEDIDYYTYFDDIKQGFGILKWWPMSTKRKTWSFNEIRDYKFSGLGTNWYDYGNGEILSAN